MKQQSDDPLDFLINRRKGAADIAARAKAKGGDAILTFYHFQIKDSCYASVMKVLKNDGLKEAIKFAKSETKRVMNELDFINDTQKEFQALMGQIEVFGECYIKLLELDQ